MRTAVWILLGFFGVVLWSAVAFRLGTHGVLPDAAVITVVFLALKREPIPVFVSAVVLGYLVGRNALAPVGLHETALVACSIVVYIVSGRLAGSGRWFFGVIAGTTVIGYQLLLLGLLLMTRGEARFVSWPAALLVPNALVTGLLAAFSYRGMERLERRLVPERREGLSWQ